MEAAFGARLEGQRLGFVVGVVVGLGLGSTSRPAKAEKGKKRPRSRPRGEWRVDLEEQQAKITNSAYLPIIISRAR